MINLSDEVNNNPIGEHITIIDPPSGWKYGFPKAIPKEVIEQDLVEEWVIAQGYPEEKRNLLEYSRFWYEPINSKETEE